MTDGGYRIVVQTIASSLILALVFLSIDPGFGLTQTADSRCNVGRPILVMGDIGESTTGELRSICSDGRVLQRYGVMASPSWAPDGSRFAAIATTENHESKLLIVESEGNSFTLDSAPPGQGFVYQPVWSPDGTKVAVISFNGILVNLAIYDTREGDQIEQYRIQDRYTADFPYFTAGIDNLRWSPDGNYILFSWGGALVFEVGRGMHSVVSNTKTLAEWTPSSASVCELAYVLEGPNPPLLQGLFISDLDDGSKKTVATIEELNEAGIASLTGIMMLSPDGKYLAIGTRNSDQSKSELRIYRATDNCIDNIDAPITAIPGEIWAAEWSSDEDAIAVLQPAFRPGDNFNFEVRTYNLSDSSYRTLASLEFSRWTLELLGLIRVFSW